MAGLIDEQAKDASSLGIANEALGAMRDAANMAGISNENLTTSLRRMSQTLADALDGSGKGAEALNKLGLSADQLQKMRPEEAFTAIVAELDKIPNGLEKTAIAMDIFGRGGASMTNLTIAGLRQAQNDAEELGLKLTSAQAAGVEAANDAGTLIKTVFSDFLKNVTGRLAPSVKAAFDRMFEFAKRQDLQEWAAKAALGIGKAFQVSLVVLGAVGEAVIAITRGMNVAFSIANKMIGGVSALGSKNAETKLADIRKEIESLENRRWAGSSNDRILERLRREEESAQKQLTSFTAIADSAVKIDSALDGASGMLEKVQGFSMSPAVTGALKELDGMVASFDKKTEEVGGTAKTTGGTMEIAFSGSAKAAEIAGDKMERINKILEEMRGKANNAAAAVRKIPAMPDQFSSGGIDYIERAERTE